MGQMMGGGPKGDDDENSEKRGMRPGGMAPRMSTPEKEETKSYNWVTLLVCGICIFAGLIFAGVFRRRKQHKNHLNA